MTPSSDDYLVYLQVRILYYFIFVFECILHYILYILRDKSVVGRLPAVPASERDEESVCINERGRREKRGGGSGKERMKKSEGLTEAHTHTTHTHTHARTHTHTHERAYTQTRTHLRLFCLPHLRQTDRQKDALAHARARTHTVLAHKTRVCARV
jgi:hypothetical protein